MNTITLKSGFQAREGYGRADVDVDGHTFDLAALCQAAMTGTELDDRPTIVRASAGVRVGQVAWVFAMNRYRRGVVTKVGRVNVTVAYVTETNLRESAESAAHSYAYTATIREKAGKLEDVRVEVPHPAAPTAEEVAETILADADPADALALEELTQEELETEAAALEEEARQDAAEFQVSPATPEEAELADLRAEFPGADADRKLEIQGRLVALGTVVYPEGTPEHTEYAAKLKAALAAPGAWDFLDGPAEAPECPGPEGDQGHAARVADAGWCAFCGTYANGEPTPGRQADASLAKAELDDYQAAVAELDEYQRARLAAGWTVAVADSAQAERIVAALVGGGSAAVITGGADRPTEVLALSPAELEDPARLERVSESHTVQVRDPEARVVVGDVVRIHRGTALYEVIRVEEDLARDATVEGSQWEKSVMARLVPCDPENDRDPGWVSADLLHRVPPVARVRTVRVTEFQELADDPVAVAGTGWDRTRGVLRQVATVEVSGTRLAHAALLPWDGGDRQPVGCLRIGDALVVNDRCYRVVWDGDDFQEPHLVPARWRDR